MISRVLVKASPAFGRRRLLKKHGLYCFSPASFLTFGKLIVVVGAKFDLFSAEGRGFESKCVTDTRATTDKNDPFLNMGFKHGKKWVDKNGAKCNMGFGRITKNTHFLFCPNCASLFCPVSVFFVPLCFFCPRSPSPPLPPPRTSSPPGPPKNFALFRLPPQNSFFSLLSGGLLVEFWCCF